MFFLIGALVVILGIYPNFILEPLHFSVENLIVQVQR